MTKTTWMACVLASLFSFVRPASAQLTLTSGVNPAAGPNGSYAAGQFSNFGNSGGQGTISIGIQDNLNDFNIITPWQQTTWQISFTYNPSEGVDFVDIYGKYATSLGESITIPAVPATELQITDHNNGAGDLILTLTSINSVSQGGVLGVHEVAGGTENFAPGTSWSASSGETLEAYRDDPTLFSSGFTLYGSITLDAPANSANYGDDLNSLIEFNLANVAVPEPSSTALLVTMGLGALAWRKFKVIS